MERTVKWNRGGDEKREGSEDGEGMRIFGPLLLHRLLPLPCTKPCARDITFHVSYIISHTLSYTHVSVSV